MIFIKVTVSQFDSFAYEHMVQRWIAEQGTLLSATERLSSRSWLTAEDLDYAAHAMRGRPPDDRTRLRSSSTNDRGSSNPTEGHNEE
jgi:hypothetical protein